MHFLLMASIANRRRTGHRRELSDFMAKGSMTIRALYLMIRNMVPVERLRGILGAQDFRFIMTLHTFALRNMPIPLDNAQVAFLTGHPSCNILSVIEIPPFDLDIPLRCEMTGSTSTDGT